MQPVTHALDEGLAQPESWRATDRSRYRLAVAQQGDVHYAPACRFIEAQYARHFRCALRDHYPAYLYMTRNERLLAACGFRSAQQPLFLEQYLEAPVENVLAAKVGGTLLREQIVELGAFAVRHSPLAIAFMTRLAPALREMGFRHAVCTATLPVRRCLGSLGVQSTLIAAARPGCLQNSRSDWGNYYRMRPAVIAGDIPDALAAAGGGFALEA